MDWSACGIVATGNQQRHQPASMRREQRVVGQHEGSPPAPSRHSDAEVAEAALARSAGARSRARPGGRDSRGSVLAFGLPSSHVRDRPPPTYPLRRAPSTQPAPCGAARRRAFARDLPSPSATAACYLPSRHRPSTSRPVASGTPRNDEPGPPPRCSGHVGEASPRPSETVPGPVTAGRTPAPTSGSGRAPTTPRRRRTGVPALTPLRRARLPRHPVRRAGREPGTRCTSLGAQLD